jgi:hypothetical protein
LAKFGHEKTVIGWDDMRLVQSGTGKGAMPMTVEEFLADMSELKALGKEDYEVCVWIKDGTGKRAVNIDLLQPSATTDDNEKFVVYDLDI